MGTYADIEVEREIAATGKWMMEETIRADRRHAAKRREPQVDLSALSAFAAEPDDPLTVTTPSQHHVQVRTADGKVFAEWWPGKKGTTMMDGRRGPVCRTAADVVAWLREA